MSIATYLHDVGCDKLRAFDKFQGHCEFNIIDIQVNEVSTSQ
jgi:hypothetical protein